MFRYKKGEILQYEYHGDTVQERNLAWVAMVDIPLFSRCYTCDTSQVVVWDFFHQLNNMPHMTSDAPDVEVTVGLFPAKHEPLTSSLAGELVAGWGLEMKTCDVSWRSWTSEDYIRNKHVPFNQSMSRTKKTWAIYLPTSTQVSTSCSSNITKPCKSGIHASHRISLTSATPKLRCRFGLLSAAWCGWCACGDQGVGELCDCVTV